MDKPIPCLDLGPQLRQTRDEIFELFGEVYDRAAFSGSVYVDAFEKDFSAFCGVPHTVGVSNGTTALHLAMLALGIGPGDDVLVPANTYIATAWGVSHAGATPVFVDCLPDTWQIDVAHAASKLSPRTRAVIGVHLYGQPCDIDALRLFCSEHDLLFIEDAAQAQGAKYRGEPVGGFGELACYSFYPAKNLGACGEAGGITTRNEQYAQQIRLLRNQGSYEKYFHEVIGYNYRMGGLEAASLIVKLRYLEAWNSQRRSVADRYRSGMRNERIRLQAQPDWADSAHHLFVVTADDRAAFCDHLLKNGIQPAFHYPLPCHLQKAYAHLGYQPGDLPQAEYLAAHGVSLPMFPGLSEEQADRVIQTINAY